MSKRVAVILSGCGFMDGAEIHESVCALLALSKAGAAVSIFAPDSEFAVVDHLKGEATSETRNVLTESARIARGQIADISTAKVEDFDAVVLPGGYGAATNLCTFAEAGPECAINPDVAALLQGFQAAGKPIGAICIAPAVVAKALGEQGPTLTIGNDAGTAQALEAMGAKHQDCAVTDCVVDAATKVATTPAYMYAPTVAEVYTGIEKCINSVLEMA